MSRVQESVVLRIAPRCLARAAVWFAILAAGAIASADDKKVVIPFDCVSKFDDGQLGRQMADIVWKRIDREKRFIVPESLVEVRDFCAAKSIRVTPDMSLEQVKKYVVDDFGAHIGVWGGAELAPGQTKEIYDIVLKCVDFSVDPPKVIYDVKARTNAAAEIPHRYIKELIDKLYDRPPDAAKPPDPVAEENWKKNPNLVVGGDFESGVKGVPYGWEDRGGQKREPLGRQVQWLADTSTSGNKVIRLTMDKGVAESTGVMYYSLPFPIEEGSTYRFQCRYRSNGPSPKVFIKCYDAMPSEYKSAKDLPKTASASSGRLTQGERYQADAMQDREVYRSQQNLKGPLNQWNVQTEDFTPRHTKYTPRTGRVMLYGYLHPGVLEFDDVVVKLIVPASPGEKIKEKKHSSATKVTLKEMEENKRRSEELKRKARGETEPKRTTP